jgi:hypothetical protein
MALSWTVILHPEKRKADRSAAVSATSDARLMPAALPNWAIADRGPGRHAVISRKPWICEVAAQLRTARVLVLAFGFCAVVNLPAIVAVAVAVRDGSGDLRWTSAGRLGRRVRRNAATRPYLISEGSPARSAKRRCSTKGQQPGRITFDLHRPGLAC